MQHMSHCADVTSSCAGNNEQQQQQLQAAVVAAVVVAVAGSCCCSSCCYICCCCLLRVAFEACAKFMRTICEIYCNDKRLAHNSPHSAAICGEDGAAQRGAESTAESVGKAEQGAEGRQSSLVSRQFEPEASNHTALVAVV